MSEQKTINGRYRLGEAMQAGPLATTYLAEDLESGDQVVLKELAIHARTSHLTSEDVFKREQLLEREGKILRHLEHPQIPRFIDTFRTEDDGRVSLWLVQEYRPGKNLEETIVDGWHGSADDVARVLREVAGILDYLHSRVPPIVHRDVKPANIIIGPDDKVCLVDLGAVCTRVLSQREGSTIIGTPGYVPLEQFAGQAVPASDIYALGMVGVHMVTHEEPLKLTTDDGTVRYRHLTSVDHPTLLDTIDRMIEPRVSARLRSAREVIAWLDGERQLPAVVPPARRRVVPAPWLALGVGVLALAGVATAVLTLKSSEDTSANLEQAYDMDVALDEEYPEPPVDEVLNPELLDPSVAVVAAPAPCQVVRDGDDDHPLSCTRYSGAIEPMVMGPGRLRLILDELPEGLTEPAALAEAEVTPLWVVDFTRKGRRLVGAVVCPDDSQPAAVALGSDGGFHVACTDFAETMHHVVLAPGAAVSRSLGSYTVPYDEETDIDLGTALDPSDGMVDRPVLVVPDRGPAFLVYSTYSMGEEYTRIAQVQPLARGARSFSLFPATQLGEIGEWVIYQDAGRVFALVRARSRASGNYGLFKVQVSSTSSRLIGPFDFPAGASGELTCHQLSTAASTSGLEIRSPNDFGDRQLTTVIAKGRAFPGPTVAPDSATVCGEPNRVFARLGTAEAQLEFDGMQGSEHLTCDGRHCLLGFRTDEGLGLLPLDL